MREVSFAGTWEIETSSAVVREFGTVTSLVGFGDLGLRAFIADVVALGVSASGPSHFSQIFVGSASRHLP